MTKEQKIIRAKVGLLELAVNHGAWRQEIDKRNRRWKTQAFVTIAAKLLQMRIRCDAAIIWKCAYLRNFRGRLAILAACPLIGAPIRFRRRAPENGCRR